MVGVVKVEKRWGKGWNWKDGRANVDEVLRTDVGGATVYVYRIETDVRFLVCSDFRPYRVCKDFGKFYIATDGLGKIWGWGESPREALKDALNNWKEAGKQGHFNPFYKALKPLKEKIKEEIKTTLEPISEELNLTERDFEDILFENYEDYEYLFGKSVGVLDVEPEFFINVGNGTVAVYHMSVSPVNGNELNLPEGFYIVTLDVKGVEKVWGLGKTVKGALKDAVKEWDELTGGYTNPFRKALKETEY
jgi:hypothetical protein